MDGPEGGWSWGWSCSFRLPPNPETLSSSSAWSALRCYFRPRSTKTSTTSFSLPAPLPTGKKKTLGERELPCNATCPNGAETSTLGHIVEKTHHVEREPPVSLPSNLVKKLSCLALLVPPRCWTPPKQLQGVFENTPWKPHSPPEKGPCRCPGYQRVNARGRRKRHLFDAPRSAAQGELNCPALLLTRP